MKKLIVLLLACFSVWTAKADNIDAGKKIFTQRCTSCHAVGKQVVGPDLKDIDKERSTDWIIKFVHGSQAVINSGDTAAVNIFNQFNKTIMPNHPDLTDGDIQNIIAYIKDASTKVKDNGGVIHVPDAGPIYKNVNPNNLIHRMIFLDVNGDFQPMTFEHIFFWCALGVAILLLIVALLKMVKLNSDIQDVK